MTLHRLADRRAVPAARLADDDPAVAPDPEELTEWALLAERAGHVLDDLERQKNRDFLSPDLSALLTETAGLRAALDAANDRRLSIRAIIEATRKRVEEESAD